MDMVIYNIDYDRMYIVPAVCPRGSREEDTNVNLVYYKRENGEWKLKVKGARNKEGRTEKWKCLIELNEQDAKSAWNRRKEILKKEYTPKRQYPQEFMEMTIREPGVAMAQTV